MPREHKGPYSLSMAGPGVLTPFQRQFFLLCFQGVPRSVFLVILVRFGEPFRRLSGDFLSLFGGLCFFAGWHSLCSENPYFEVWAIPGCHLFDHSFQVLISGGVFTRFCAIFCDFGGHLGSLWAPLGTLFRVNGAPGSRMGSKVGSRAAQKSL